jgi:hypothetical protein
MDFKHDALGPGENTLTIIPKAYEDADLVPNQQVLGDASQRVPRAPCASVAAASRFIA